MDPLEYDHRCHTLSSGHNSALGFGCESDHRCHRLSHSHHMALGCFAGFPHLVGGPWRWARGAGVVDLVVVPPLVWQARDPWRHRGEEPVREARGPVVASHHPGRRGGEGAACRNVVGQIRLQCRAERWRQHSIPRRQPSTVRHYRTPRQTSPRMSHDELRTVYSARRLSYGSPDMGVVRCQEQEAPAQRAGAYKKGFQRERRARGSTGGKEADDKDGQSEEPRQRGPHNTERHSREGDDLDPGALRGCQRPKGKGEKGM
jgi:hypothetical protein